MVLVYVAYYIILIKGQDKKPEESYENVQSSGYALAGYLSAGFVLLISSSHLVVENAMQIANQWGIAQSLVGIVIVGLGTSLPELAVSVGAAFRKSAGMSVGNVIGSNIFDGLIPIGLGGMISQIKTESSMLAFDLPYLFISSLLVLLFLRSKRGISTVEGILLICIFILYLAIKIHLPPA